MEEEIHEEIHVESSLEPESITLSDVKATNSMAAFAPPVQSHMSMLASTASLPSVPPLPANMSMLASTASLPSVAPLPGIVPSISRPLAPLPIHPPILRQLLSQNGDLGGGVASNIGDPNQSRTGTGPTAEYEVSEESKQVRERQEKAMQELLLKRRASALAVPTNDTAVRARLRRLEEPITLFGEREMERRDRLRMIMARLDAEGQLEKLLKAHEDEEVTVAAKDDFYDEILQYPFYTEGSKELLNARIQIVRYSIARAAKRLERARRKRENPDEDLDSEFNWALKQAATLVLDCSEIGDDRPLSGCSFSRDGNLLATCSMSGAARLWSIPEMKKISALKGHTERATDVTFSPVQNHLATASADRTARLWNAEGFLMREFKGHLDRLARIAFHPSGKYLGTASFDKTWRLWDAETGVELLLQEGHSRSLYGICFHRDGSLAASCGMDALARVWDLRSGKSILALEGHVKPVLGISFSPNGYHLATGGEDNTCRVWDLRKKKSLYIIPAHSNLISQVRYEPHEGYFLVTASYDTTAKLWSARDFKPIKTLSGHEAKITALDVVEDGQLIATVSHDRTIKLWSGREGSKEDINMDVD